MKLRTVALAGAFALVCLAPAAQANPANARLTQRRWRWLCQRLHARHRAAVHRSCPDSVRPEPRPAERTCGGRRPTKPAGDRRKLERLLRRLCSQWQFHWARQRLARLLPLGERRRELHELTRSWLPGRQVAVRRACARANRGLRRPVLAWDSHGRCSQALRVRQRERPTRRFGDVWVATYENPGGESGATSNDGKEFVRSLDVAQGSAAPGITGVFHDKTAIEVDRTGGSCDGNVYFAWARFTGGGRTASTRASTSCAPLTTGRRFRRQ